MDPSENTVRKPKGRIFYGWWVVLAGVLAGTITGWTNYFGFQAFILPLTKEFGWNRRQITGAISLAQLEGAALGPIDGWLIDRFGPRRMMFVGVTILGIGFVALSKIDSLFGLYIVFVGLIAIGSSAGTLGPAQVAAANWFVRKRTMASALVFTGMPIGGILVPLMVWLIETHGWRTTCVIVALVVWFVGYPMASLVRHKPEQYGYLPDGDTQIVSSAQTSQPQQGSGSKTVLEDDFTVKEALTSPSFYLLALAFSTRSVASSAIAAHQLPFLVQDLGMSTALAATIVSITAALAIPSRLLVGYFGDRWNKRYMYCGCMVIMSASMFTFSGARSLPEIFLAAALFATAFGGTAPLMFGLRGEFFGRKNYGTIGGFMSPLMVLGTIGGPFWAATVFDLYGSYRTAFLTTAFANLLGVFFMLAAKRPTLSRPPADTGAGAEEVQTVSA
ncbi:MAG: MFS transporter [Dehalococcoidia bacterium]|nr:MFS transporter [Dehalococcoidia bacterium]